MSLLRVPPKVARWAGLLVLASSLGCPGDDTKSSEPKLDLPKVEPKLDLPEPEPKLDLPEPEPKLDLPPPKPIERCKIVLAGDGPAIEKAVVKASSGIKAGEVEDGHTVGYDCPDEADRTDINVIARVEGGKPVHWEGVEVDAEGGGTIQSADSKPGAPDGMTKEDIKQMAAELDVKSSELDPEQFPPPPSRSKVVFMPELFPKVDVEVVGKGTSKKFTLEGGKKSVALPPGSYEVFLSAPGDAKKKAGKPLEIEAGKSYTVKMLKRSPYVSITAQ